MSIATADLRRTALCDVHCQLNGKMVEFGGWHMPVQYAGVLKEHTAVRTAVGLFDVSHMGEIEIRGQDAAALTDFVSTNNAGKLKVGQAHYSALLYEHGGFVDDILVHKVADDHFFICVNASNQWKDFEHIEAMRQKAGFTAEVDFASERYAQLAVQGPLALQTLQKLTATDLSAIKYYWFTDGSVADVPGRIARTGYTGEDGFEVYIAPEFATKVWFELLSAGEEFGIEPCGLGARNTLRLEAKMALYGHEITATTNPFEADLGWIVKLDKPSDFVGREALEKVQAQGITRKLTGFAMRGRGIGRDGYEVLVGGQPAGWVTSGGPSPTTNANIGLCYLPVEHSEPGVEIQVMIRNTPVDAVTVPTPFYKRQKK
jgi:aminomethyltransferase